MKRHPRRTTSVAARRRLRRLVPLLGAVAGVGASAIDGFDLPNAEVAARYQRALAEFRCPKWSERIAGQLRRAHRGGSSSHRAPTAAGGQV